MSRLALLGLAFAVVAGKAVAQDAGSLLRESERQTVRPLAAPLASKVEVTRPERKNTVSNGVSVNITHLVFSGKTSLISPEERDRLVDRMAGKTLDLAGLRDLADEATRLAQTGGRIFARAFLPPQDVTEGVVEIALVEARVEEVAFVRVGAVRVREEVLREIEQHYLGDRSSLTDEKLEAALLHINSLPGVKVRANVEAGKAPGTSRVSIGVEEGPLVTGEIWGDNFGSASTGKAQANALVSINDPLGYGEQLRFQGLASEGLAYGRFSASAPVGAEGTVVNGAYSYLTYHDVTGTGRRAGLEGDGHQLSLGMSQALVREKVRDITLGGVLTGKALRNDSAAGLLDDKRLLTAGLSLSGTERDYGGATSWGLEAVYGVLELSRVASSAAFDATGLRTEGGFARFNARIERQQRIADDWTFLARANGQWASKNLDSSEEMSLGGPYGVRGWPVGEASADMGAIGTLELRRDIALPEGWGMLQLGGFFDAGYARINARPKKISLASATGDNDYGLFATGLTLNWQRENLLMTGGWGIGLGDNPGRGRDGTNVDGETGRHQLWLSGRMKF